jgi:N-acetylmuramoyl-L-alanine amidase
MGAAPLDFATGGGQFYTQAAGGGSAGFLVSDDGGLPFLTELRSRGGPEGIGYPISQRFDWKGTTVQAFQKAVLQWLPGEHRVAFLNVFDDLTGAGKNPWLHSVRSTPEPTWLRNEGQLTWDEVVAQRLAFLDTNPAIKARYYSVADPTTLFGLPSSRVEDMGSHYAIRLQRAVIQQWKSDVPWARAGETTVANGGDIAKEAGMFPGGPLQPTGPDQAARPISAGPINVTYPIAAPAAPAMPASSAVDIPRAGARRRVVLDPGHGGGQVGAAGYAPDGRGLLEKDLNLEIVRRAASLLRAAGYDVTQTRDSDRQVSGPDLKDDLQARIDVANAAHADVFVSVHNNGIGNRAQQGTEVYYAADRPFSDRSRALAQLLFDNAIRSIQAAGYSPVPRGIKTDTSIDGLHLYLLSPKTARVDRPSEMPSALIEGLFLTNLSDVAQLARPEIREAIAHGVAVAIGSFLSAARG